MVDRKPNLLVPHYILHCYLYYVLDDPAISDDCFDGIVKRLQEKWETIEHRHKGLLEREFLKSGFALKYPEIAEGAARSLKRWLER